MSRQWRVNYMKEIKPCPFCSSDDTHVADGGDQRAYFVLCYNCEAQGPEHGTISQAVDVWNSRVGGES